MVDRIDLLIAVVAIVIVLGSSTARGRPWPRSPDREDLVQLRQNFHSLEAKVAADLNRVETKLDGLILRLVPEARS